LARVKLHALNSHSEKEIPFKSESEKLQFKKEQNSYSPFGSG
jgi:hypothetical protein